MNHFRVNFDHFTSKNIVGFLNLIDKKTGLLIVPFTYVGLSTARQVIEKYIKPHKIAVDFPIRSCITVGGWMLPGKG